MSAAESRHESLRLRALALIAALDGASGYSELHDAIEALRSEAEHRCACAQCVDAANEQYLPVEIAT